MNYVLCNKETSILKGEGKNLSYFEILKSLIDSTPVNGITISQMRQDFAIIDKLDESLENAKFSLDEINRIVEFVESTPFAIKHRDIITMYDYVVNIKNLTNNG